MKRTVSLLLALLLLGTVLLPAAAESDVNSYLQGETSLAKLSFLEISTGGRNKQLELHWGILPRAGGYEVFRSATGKTGSYKRIAEVYDSTYTDAGLKASTVYYYAVRAFAWNGEKTIYSPFRKASLSTRITKAYAAKRFNAAYKAMAAIMGSVDFSDALRENADGGYYRLDLKNCGTASQLKAYLRKYFSKTLTKRLMPKMREQDGKLYVWMPSGIGGADYLLLRETRADKLSYEDREVRFRLFVEQHTYADGDEPTVVRLVQGLRFEGGRWVIDDTGASFWVNRILFDYA